MSVAHTLSRYLLIVMAVCLSMADTAFGESSVPQRIKWDRAPLSVPLTVGEERMVHFRAPVSVGLPVGLEALLRTQTVNGTVYLRASSAFPSTRIVVRELDGGQVYLLDVHATAEGHPLPPVTIFVEETLASDPYSSQDANHRHIGYVALTRYAAQQLYAPLRLLSAHPGIVRQPVREQAVRFVPGDGVTATPLAAWRAGSLYVTAVKLTNRLKSAQVLDPRTLRGEWLAATFQHARLLPAGDEADTTAVYLVSAQPFEASF